ncbi:ABC transporter permease [Mammaliicoccus sp. Dog046]|uniref:ABC transporter permease n=1 Tax=Mammaliicoccus sp. Dog046 TaxID=3034233 RepID=UPI002B25A764|nr:FtsX-like permease family protein [Mammaliicoccus sp. Dog046]WQK85452.1 FtsX-like permease family protein [Mammaliicoccus sp. Dog046]
MINLFKDVFKLLLRNKRQSILTSIAIAIASFVVLFVQASSEFTNQSLSDNLQVDKNQTTLNFVSENVTELAGFTEEDKNLIENVINKKAQLVSSSYGTMVNVFYGDSKQILSYRTVENLKKNEVNLPEVIKGKKLEEQNKRSNEIAISDKALLNLTRQNNIETFINKDIKIKNKNYKISTIYKASTINELVPSLIITEQIKKDVMQNKMYYDEMLIKTQNQKEINKALDSLDRNGSYKNKGSYTYTDNKGVYEETKSQTETILNFIALLSSISIFVAGFGVMNAMFSSISERSKEIAIRRALGAKKSDIQLSYIIEGTVLSSLGGLTGIISILICITLMNMLGIVASLTGLQIIITFIATVGFGIVFSIIPAMVAANKNMVEGLK